MSDLQSIAVDLTDATARAERDRRRHAISAADIEQGRLERDLHDGVQPQLVSVAMTLALSRPELVERLVAALQAPARLPPTASERSRPAS